MTKKRDLEKAIKEAEETIADLEQKRLRSMCAFMEAIVNKEEPSPDDVEYFKAWSKLIAFQRDKIRALKDELEEL